MSPNLLNVTGTVRAVEDAGVAAAASKERVLVIHVPLEWKTGNPAGVLSLRLYCKNDRETTDEAGAWPLGCKVKVAVERPETEVPCTE